MLGVGVGVGLKHLMGNEGGYITVPTFLTDSVGIVFTDSEGAVMTHGTVRVRPIETIELPDKVDAILLSSSSAPSADVSQ